MINAIDGNNAAAGGSGKEVTEPAMDPLAAKRAHEGRMLALAATKAQHMQRVQAAVEAFTNIPAETSSQPSATLERVQAAYRAV